jgi:outer membrane receptor for ferrienterochelin and colicins
MQNLSAAMMTKISSVIFCCFLSYSSFSQTDSSISKDLNEVVVTGQLKPQSMKNSVYQVKVISAERIQKQAATKLQDVLNTELNMRFTQDQATGGFNITMQGLAGQNVKILLDGMPLVGRQGINNEININQIDINTIEKIEIVEGPMSVMYGADALGGVINIITKKSTASKWSLTAKQHEETVGDEYSIFAKGIHNSSLAATLRYKKWQLGGNIGYNYFGGWKDTASGRELLWHKKDQILGSGFLNYHNHQFSIGYRLDAFDEKITDPANYTFYQQASGNWFAPDKTYFSNRVMQQLQSTYKFSSNLYWQTQLAYSVYNREVFATLKSLNNGKQYINSDTNSQSTARFTGLNFRTSASYQLNKMFSFQPGVDINLDRGDGERLAKGVNGVDDYAFFISSEFTPTAAINIKPGVRFIHNTVYDAPTLVPSLNTKFVISKAADLRLSYASGFRAPSLRELYFNFFDANHQIIGNPDLKAETSHSFNGSFNWKKLNPGKLAYSTVVSGFYNRVKNMIDYAPSASNPNVFVVSNVTDSKTGGFSLQTLAKYQQWNMQVGFAYTGFYNAYSSNSKELPTLNWSPEANANISYKFERIGLGVNAFYKFTGKTAFYRVDSSGQFIKSNFKAYHMADLSFTKQMGKYLQLNAGIRNLFDVDRVGVTGSANGGIHVNGGLSRSIATGRAYFTSLVFNISK